MEEEKKRELFSPTVIHPLLSPRLSEQAANAQLNRASSEPSMQPSSPLPLLQLQASSSSISSVSLFSPVPPTSAFHFSPASALDRQASAPSLPSASPVLKPTAAASAAVIVPSSPLGGGDESDSDSDSDSDGGKGGKAEDSIYHRPLLYYKRTAAASSSSSGSASSYSGSAPVQLFLPNRSMCLGFPPVSSTVEEESDANTRLMVFSLPTDDMRHRTTVLSFLILMLVVVDFVLVCLVYGGGDWVASGGFSDGRMDAVTFACTLCELTLAVIAMQGRDTRIITLFVVRQHAPHASQQAQADDRAQRELTVRSPSAAVRCVCCVCPIVQCSTSTRW